MIGFNVRQDGAAETDRVAFIGTVLIGYKVEVQVRGCL